MRCPLLYLSVERTGQGPGCQEGGEETKALRGDDVLTQVVDGRRRAIGEGLIGALTPIARVRDERTVRQDVGEGRGRGASHHCGRLPGLKQYLVKRGEFKVEREAVDRC